MCLTGNGNVTHWGCTSSLGMHILTENAHTLYRVKSGRFLGVMLCLIMFKSPPGKVLRTSCSCKFPLLQTKCGYLNFVAEFKNAPSQQFLCIDFILVPV